MPEQEYLIIDRLSTKDITRIFNRIIVTTSGCWEWQGQRRIKAPYGVITFRKRCELIHRVVYAWAVGPIPRRVKGQRTPQLDHAGCDNPSCCNPVHMKLVTPRENNRRSTKSVAGIKSRKTHCIRGHLLPPPNPEGVRRCKPCAHARWFRESAEQRERRRSYSQR